jgi:hypothetical protein
VSETAWDTIYVGMNMLKVGETLAEVRALLEHNPGGARASLLDHADLLDLAAKKTRRLSREIEQAAYAFRHCCKDGKNTN